MLGVLSRWHTLMCGLVRDTATHCLQWRKILISTNACSNPHFQKSPRNKTSLQLLIIQTFKTRSLCATINKTFLFSQIFISSICVCGECWRDMKHISVHVATWVVNGIYCWINAFVNLSQSLTCVKPPEHKWSENGPPFSTIWPEAHHHWSEGVKTSLSLSLSDPREAHRTSVGTWRWLITHASHSVWQRLRGSARRLI